MSDQDQKLVEEAKMDPEKFGPLYDKYFDQIYRYVYRRTNDRDVTHDLVSQTFYDALTHLKNFEWRGYPFVAWLYKIAHNNVLKWYRDGKKGQMLELDEARGLHDPQVDVTGDAMKIEEMTEIQALLEKLEPEEREIIRLKYFEEVSNIEIAEIMGLSANNIGVKIYRTLKKAKQLLQA